MPKERICASDTVISKRNLINELYSQLSGIQAVADSMTNVGVAWEMSVDAQNQIHGISQSIMALTEKADNLVSEIEQADCDVKPAATTRMSYDIDKVDLLKLSVTELHGILTVLNETQNNIEHSSILSDYFTPLWEDTQDAFYKARAQSASEALMKLVALTEDEVGENYSKGLDTLKEAYKFIGNK